MRQNQQWTLEMNEALMQIPGCDCRLQANLAPFTTFAVGGPADLLIRVKSEDALRQVLERLYQERFPFTVLGAGSNVLIADKGIRGAVLLLDEEPAALEVNKDGLRAQAALRLFQLSAASARHSLSGLEFCCGIPGSLGGAVSMNAGAYGGTLSDQLSLVTFFDEDGQVREASPEELDFGYRHSYFSDHKAIVLAASFRLTPGDSREIYSRIAEFQARRRQSQPLNEKSAGSSFKRPEGHFAGQLISEAGWKGKSLGPAGVSAKHAGFIVNHGAATATEIKAVFEAVKRDVLAQSGVQLEAEVRFLGEWGN